MRRGATGGSVAFDPDEYWLRGRRAARRARVTQVVLGVVIALAVCSLVLWAWHNGDTPEPEVPGPVVVTSTSSTAPATTDDA